METPTVMTVMTELQTVIVIINVLVIAQKYVEEAGKIVSTELVGVVFMNYQ